MAFRLAAHALQAARTALWISDVHIDPYYGTELSLPKCRPPAGATYGWPECDTPYPLFYSALKEAARALPKPDYVFLTGDFVRHWPEYMPGQGAEVISLLTNVTQEIVNAFPESAHVHLPVIEIGNDDLFPSYTLNFNDSQAVTPLLGKMAGALKHMLEEDELETFTRGGYYARDLGGGLLALGINTVLYSIKHQPDTTRDPDPLDQFEWLRAQLHRARVHGQRAYIVGHIGPGMDSWALEPMWEEPYVATYIDIMQEYSDVVAAQMFGHLHSDEFRVLPGVRAPVLFAGAISTIFKSNPAFRVLSLDPWTWDILDYKTHWADIKACGNSNCESLEWQPTAGELAMYNLPAMQGPQLRDLAHSLFHDNEKWDTWRRAYYAYAPSPQDSCTDVCRVQQVCLMTTLFREDHDRCVRDHIDAVRDLVQSREHLESLLEIELNRH